MPPQCLTPLLGPTDPCILGQSLRCFSKSMQNVNLVRSQLEKSFEQALQQQES